MRNDRHPELGAFVNPSPQIVNLYSDEVFYDSGPFLNTLITEAHNENNQNCPVQYQTCFSPKSRFCFLDGW